MSDHRQLSLIIVLLFIFLSCDKENDSITFFNDIKQVKPVEKKLHNIHIIQTDYDSLVIKNAPGLILESKSIIKINFYKKDCLNYTFIDSLTPDYSGNYGSYSPVFEFNISVNKRDLFFEFQVEFILYDSSMVRFDSSSTMCKYPYKTAEVYFLHKDLPYPADRNIKSAEDFDFYDGKFYYRVSGGYGIYEIDMITGESRILFDHVSHNFISVDSGSLFYTISPQMVIKQDLLSENRSRIISFNYPTINDSVISGLESENGILYLIIEGEGSIIKLDYEGNPLKSVPYPRRTFALSKHEDKLYSLIYGQSITVLNLNSEQFEDDKPIPSKNTQSIRIDNNYLYYTEWERAYIGRIPIEDVLGYVN